MNTVKRALSKRFFPTIAITTGAVVATGIITAQMLDIGKAKSPWTANDPLVIGVFVPPAPSGPAATGAPQRVELSIPTKEGYEQLKQQMTVALQEQLEGDVVIELDVVQPSEVNPVLMDQLTQKIKTKAWDIAFTTIPTISVTARENDYQFAARMFPDKPQFNYAFFVRKDSTLQSTENMNAATKIALGELSSELLFLFPVYDLYGSVLTADVGNIIPTMIKKVGSGQVDVGVTLAQLFQVRPDLSQNFRIIQEGRAIPTSGVYLSPEVEDYHDLLKETLLEMPDEVQKAARYGAGSEPDYQYMEGVIQRAQTITNCHQWKPAGVLERVEFYCDESPQPPPELPVAPATGIVGRANGYIFRSNGDVEIKLQAVRPAGEPYKLIVPQKILSTDPGIPSTPQAMTGKYIHIQESVTANGNELKIDEAGQMQLVQSP